MGTDGANRPGTCCRTRGRSRHLVCFSAVLVTVILTMCSTHLIGPFPGPRSGSAPSVSIIQAPLVMVHLSGVRSVQTGVTQRVHTHSPSDHTLHCHCVTVWVLDDGPDEGWGVFGVGRWVDL